MDSESRALAAAGDDRGPPGCRHLAAGLSVQEALEAIRGRELGEKIVYFYVVDAEDRLAGVLPTRRLLTAGLDQRLQDIMVPRVMAIPQTATLLEACEAFVLHKFLAFPVVDEQRRIVGVVDVSFFTQEVFDLSGEEEEPPRTCSRQSGSKWPRCGTRRRCGRFGSGFPGCWRRLAAARFAHCWPAGSR